MRCPFPIHVFCRLYLEGKEIGILSSAVNQRLAAGNGLRPDRPRLYHGLRDHRLDQLRPWRCLHDRGVCRLPGLFLLGPPMACGRHRRHGRLRPAGGYHRAHRLPPAALCSQDRRSDQRHRGFVLPGVRQQPQVCLWPRLQGGAAPFSEHHLEPRRRADHQHPGCDHGGRHRPPGVPGLSGLQDEDRSSHAHCLV